MPEPTVRSWTEDRVGWIEIDSPPLNILTPEVRSELLASLETMQREVRCIVLTSAGERSFCAGADLGEEAELTEESVWRFIEEDRYTYLALERSQVPVVAAINGHCMGGGLDLALACDIRVAAEHARFRCPGVRVGLVANAVRLVTLIGEARAKDLVITGRDFYAFEAERFGVVTKVVPINRLRAEAGHLAEMIGARAPLAVAASRRVCRGASDLPFDEALSLEEQEFARLTQTRDHKAAVESFLSGRRDRVEFEGR